MSIQATIICDSVSPDGVRLTTYELVFPRFILAELNTHRVFSRNSASSRAIPPEKQIERVLQDPFVPEFGSRVAGMGEGELGTFDQAQARNVWMNARDCAISSARDLLQVGVDKSRINRLLEPFMWHTAIVSATEWSNFFALRTDEGTQKEFRELALKMKDQYEGCKPWVVNYGQWHLPLVPDFPMDSFDGDWEPWIKRSVSRCARVSYDRHHDDEPVEKTLARYDSLVKNGHLSPLEHAATPLEHKYHFEQRYGDDVHEQWGGNFRGWHQHRQDIPHQDNRARVLELEAMSNDPS